MTMAEHLTFNAPLAVNGGLLHGVAHVFGTRALKAGRYEEFAPTAFDEALKTSDVRAFVAHDTKQPLGRQSNGTVRLAVADGRLNYEIDTPDTSYAEDLRKLVARGDVTEMSFGVEPGLYHFAKASDGRTVRIHTSVSALYDISPVALPAFEGTSALLNSKSPDESIGSQTVRARARVRSL